MKYNRRNLVSEKINDYLVLLDHETGILVSLNSTASLIWGLLRKPITTKEIYHKVRKVYPDASSQDIGQCLKQLKKEKMIEVSR